MLRIIAVLRLAQKVLTLAARILTAVLTIVGQHVGLDEQAILA